MCWRLGRRFLRNSTKVYDAADKLKRAGRYRPALKTKESGSNLLHFPLTGSEAYPKQTQT